MLSWSKSDQKAWAIRNVSNVTVLDVSVPLRKRKVTDILIGIIPRLKVIKAQIKTAGQVIMCVCNLLW